MDRLEPLRHPAQVEHLRLEPQILDRLGEDRVVAVIRDQVVEAPVDLPVARRVRVARRQQRLHLPLQIRQHRVGDPAGGQHDALPLQQTADMQDLHQFAQGEFLDHEHPPGLPFDQPLGLQP